VPPRPAAPFPNGVNGLASDEGPESILAFMCQMVEMGSENLALFRISRLLFYGCIVDRRSLIPITGTN